MDRQEKYEILAERNKQNDLTFNFIKSISLILSGILLLTMVVGLLMQVFFDAEFLEENGLTSAFGDLRSFLFAVITLLVVNVAGLFIFARGEVLGLIAYVLTNIVFTGFFLLWVITDFELFALLLLPFFLSFSMLVGFYGMRKIKFKKEISMYQD